MSVCSCPLGYGAIYSNSSTVFRTEVNFSPVTCTSALRDVRPKRLIMKLKISLPTRIEIQYNRYITYQI